MIEKNTQIRELYDLKHFHDSNLHIGSNYEKKLFSNLFSNMMFDNNMLNKFLNLLQNNAVWMIDSVLPIRNFWNFSVSKYYNKHNN